MRRAASSPQWTRRATPRPGLAAVLAAGLLAGCAAADRGPPCPPGAAEAVVAEAYFGRNAEHRAAVTEDEWRDFLADTVTPAFPDGLTSLDGMGQWRDRQGQILREASKVVVVVLPGADIATARSRLHAVAEAWKARFRQHSVMTVFRQACVSF